jgi:isopentenyl phosphate kinase
LKATTNKYEEEFIQQKTHNTNKNAATSGVGIYFSQSGSIRDYQTDTQTHAILPQDARRRGKKQQQQQRQQGRATMRPVVARTRSRALGRLVVFHLLGCVTWLACWGESKEQQPQQQQQQQHPPYSVPPSASGAGAAVVLVKVGGSSITNKAVRETKNDGALRWFANAIRNAKAQYGIHFVVVHGAGSFGHFTAKEYGLQGQTSPPPDRREEEGKEDVDDKYNSDCTGSEDAGTTHQERQRWTMQGLAQTRYSVQALNRAVVHALLAHNVSAVGISPCFGIPGLQAHGGGGGGGGIDDRSVQTGLHEVLASTLAAGLTPVLHGDACLYGTGGGARILSGDTLMELLGRAPWVTHAVFLTVVDGVYTADPSIDPGAVLLHTLRVDPVTARIRFPGRLDAASSSHPHDVTGGLNVCLFLCPPPRTKIVLLLV